MKDEPKTQFRTSRAGSPLREENRIVHGVWIGDRLSLLERLTITLFQNAGHEFHLWSYSPPKNLPEGTIWRDAATVLPQSSIFAFNGIPHPDIPNGGKGSLSHWSDQFQCKLLYQEGGIYSQLDIAVLGPLDFEQPYAFAPQDDESLAAALMKVPKGSPFALACYETLSREITAESLRSLDWGCSMNLIMQVARKFQLNNKRYVLSKREYWDLGSRYSGPFYEDHHPPSDVRIIHWSNATNREYKDRPIRGSFYAQILERVGLIEVDDPVLSQPNWRFRREQRLRHLKHWVAQNLPWFRAAWRQIKGARHTRV